MDEKGDVTLQKCGVRFKPPTLVIVYAHNDTGKLRKRSMPVRLLKQESKVSQVAEELCQHPKHGMYLKKIPLWQLEKMLCLMQNKLKGLSLDESLEATTQEYSINANEDLNKLDDEALEKKKTVMSESFEKNRKKPGDLDYVYDIEVDFNSVNASGQSEWDSD
ncbi:PREDICTED: centrosomal protein of 19 kDa-like [Priapulus caudatus]|uniref:Centrosomal protein of 19 kDa n=1 Tax=Priapulus caudatus TaxID=37621 RepID=A0ABM1EVI0_PRICU|nr:PREDICTED: centrosomal protein of 19 kDa-like [Priapulus caudatus]XP_014676200.1 PREDICTED: centrosomal protein of 19 kDa-like [Priapulus caudatus]XP_014676201.1 PREDICTED: centrosomal protein of 19 kDa-like [Priapulus caudatus]